jgi:heme-degrading monooxygenase HmoA
MPKNLKNLGQSKLDSSISEGAKWFKLLAKPVLGLHLAVCLGACSVATPFRKVPEGIVQAEKATTVVVITEATLGGSSEQRSGFWTGVRSVQDVLPSQPGLIGYSLRQELLGNRVWTMTIWQSEVDVRRFAATATHRQAMQSGAEALINLRFARLKRDQHMPVPTWDEAMDALEVAGKKY